MKDPNSRAYEVFEEFQTTFETQFPAEVHKFPSFDSARSFLSRAAVAARPPVPELGSLRIPSILVYRPDIPDGQQYVGCNFHFRMAVIQWIRHRGKKITALS